MQQRQDLRDGLVKRAGQAGRPVGEIEEVRRWNQGILKCDMVAAGTLKSGDVPRVFDAPVTRRQHEAPDQGLATAERISP